MNTSPPSDDAAFLRGQRVAFVGKLGAVTRREAFELIRRAGGVPVEVDDPSLDVIVVGADELPMADERALLPKALREAAQLGQVEILGETQLWQRFGLIDSERDVRRLYTPAMLADLIDVPLAVVRRWHRRGLIIPAKEVRRLPYFDFQEVATARQLARLLASGVSPQAVEGKLERLRRYVPEVERPLTQLAVIVEGRDLLLRQGEGLLEPGGQMRFDFAAAEQGQSPVSRIEETSGTSAESPSAACSTAREWRDQAMALEEQGDLKGAVDVLRVALAAGGPRADVCFQLAEWLYQLGEVTAARERYYMAIELAEDFVEARANLGCVLAETGELHLAVAAFEGALAQHDDFPDAHYHLARVLDELGRSAQARRHFREFLRLAPDSPWVDQARARLEEL